VAGDSQKRALKNYRKRLIARGLARFEVVGPRADRELIRSVARRLAEGGTEAKRIRTAIGASRPDEERNRGGIFAALRRSPLVGAELDVRRPRLQGRKLDL
jgi:hypothetical protein